MNYQIMAALAALFAVTSCATPPKETAINNSRTYSISKDEAWERLLTFFTGNNIQIKTIEKDSGVIYAERAIVDTSMADCGQRPFAQELGRTATMNVFVRAVSAGTQVTVNTSFSVNRRFDNQTWTDQCSSTGSLETQVLASVGS